MRKVIIFGFGKRGKKIVEACVKYSSSVRIIAITDNAYDNRENYDNIPFVPVNKIEKYNFDEIWICTIYYREIWKQLVQKLNIEPSRIKYMEYPMPVLDERIRNKYFDEISGKSRCECLEMQEVIDYISHKAVRMYCYSFYDKYMRNPEPVYFDEDKGLFYGLYQSKKMYLSKKYNSEEKAKIYFSYVCMEQDLESPHRYLSEMFEVEKGESGIDIGAAEGIFALQVIDKVNHIYLIEPDDDWLQALQMTFEPYMDKVTIIKAFVSNGMKDNTVQLDRLFENKRLDFIKMDIEGEEFNALEGAVYMLEKNQMKLAVCTYHHALDYTKIRDFLTDRGYNCQHSQGYVICQGEWELEKDETDFRRAVLLAEKCK